MILRGGPADGEVTYFPSLSDPMPSNDRSGDIITYIDTDQLEELSGTMLRGVQAGAFVIAGEPQRASYQPRGANSPPANLCL